MPAEVGSVGETALLVKVPAGLPTGDAPVTVSTDRGTSNASAFTVAVRGDVNRDAKIDVGDAVLILQIIVTIRPSGAVEVALGDLNGNGTLEIVDAVLLLQKIVRI